MERGGGAEREGEGQSSRITLDSHTHTVELLLKDTPEIRTPLY